MDATTKEAGVGRLAGGAEVLASGGVRFRVWAPDHREVAAVLEAGPGAGKVVELAREDDGHFSGESRDAGVGTRHRYRLGGQASSLLLADPMSRFQPDGPHGPSEVVDPRAYAWDDGDWQGPGPLEGHVFYEMHVGTFTREGTWAAAADRLEDLRDLGVTAVELMPVAEFPGRFGWGYDGVNWFAPFHHYGRPDDFRRFVDRAHAVGLAVLLDVVYNHLGPDGNILKSYAEAYFSRSHVTEWGEALNFDAEGSGPVRDYVLANVAYWIDEYHVDGMRVDATQGFYDDSPVHIVTELAARARVAAGKRGALVVGESEPQRAGLLRPASRDGAGYDMLWSDDFHHIAMVAATGWREGYYGDYLGSPQEIVSVFKRGWAYQGQWDLRQSKRRGTPALDIAPAAFIFYLQNHDQVANSARGDRLHLLTSPGRHRALTALQLLAPATPLLFQGQEFAASTPFLYFGDLPRAIADAMWEGRRSFLKQFRSLETPEAQAMVPDPADPENFARSKLEHAEREHGSHAQAYAMHRDLLALRRDDPVFSVQAAGAVDGAVLGPEGLVLRWFGPGGDDRLLLVNLGAELRLPVAAEPLLAAPDGRRWGVLWSSEDPRYGGVGTPDPESEALNWVLTGQSAVALAPEDSTADEARNLPGTF